MPKLSDRGRCGEGERERRPVLKGVGVRTLGIEVRLPKASLLGSGVALEGTFGFEEGVEGVSAYSMGLRLCDLRVPTVIGVNANERLARQVVVCNLEIDRWDRMVDCYCELEEIVVKVPILLSTLYSILIPCLLLIKISLDNRRILSPNSRSISITHRRENHQLFPHSGLHASPSHGSDTPTKLSTYPGMSRETHCGYVRRRPSRGDVDRLESGKERARGQVVEGDGGRETAISTTREAG